MTIEDNNGPGNEVVFFTVSLWAPAEQGFLQGY